MVKIYQRKNKKYTKEDQVGEEDDVERNGDHNFKFVVNKNIVCFTNTSKISNSPNFKFIIKCPMYKLINLCLI